MECCLAVCVRVKFQGSAHLLYNVYFSYCRLGLYECPRCDVWSEVAGLFIYYYYYSAGKAGVRWHTAKGGKPPVELCEGYRLPTTDMDIGWCVDKMTREWVSRCSRVYIVFYDLLIFLRVKESFAHSRRWRSCQYIKEKGTLFMKGSVDWIIIISGWAANQSGLCTLRNTNLASFNCCCCCCLLPWKLSQRNVLFCKSACLL